MNRHSPVEKWFFMEDVGKGYLKKYSKNNHRSAMHEKMSLIERSLCGINASEPPLSYFDYERIEKNLFKKRNSIQNLLKDRFLGALTLAAAACAVIISVFSLSKSISVSDEFLSKGSTEAGGSPRLYAFCISSDSGVTTEITGGSSVCSKNSELQFALSNPENSEFEYLFITGVDSEGRRMYYYPEFGKEESVRIGKKISKSPFKASINLASNHRKGRVSISAVFSRCKLTYNEIKTIFQKPDGKSTKNFYIQSFSFKIK